MSAHTPTPWRVSERSASAVEGATGFIVANCGGYSNNYRDPVQLSDELHANAARIVHCVNNFDALVSALRNLADCMDEVLPYVQRPNAAADHAWNMAVQARAALRAAEES